MDFGEQQDFGSPEVSFSLTEALRFQAEVVWPALERKWGGNFDETAVPRASLQQETSFGENGDKWCQLDMGVEEDEEGDRVPYVTLRVHEPADDLLEGTFEARLADKLEAAGKINRRKRKQIRRETEKEHREGTFKARKVVAYSFYPPIFEQPFDTVTWLELLDGDGEVVWDSSSSSAQAETTDDDPDGDLYELEEALSESTAKDDYFTVMDALDALGVLRSTLSIDTQEE